MANMKKYEKLRAIETKSGEMHFIPLSAVDILKKQIETQAFIRIGTTMLNKYEITRGYEYEADDIQAYILSLPVALRKKVQHREKEKKHNLGK
jgi:hypothetical protein